MAFAGKTDPSGRREEIEGPWAAFGVLGGDGGTVGGFLADVRR